MFTPGGPHGRILPVPQPTFHVGVFILLDPCRGSMDSHACKGSLLPPEPGGTLGRGHFPYNNFLYGNGTKSRGPLAHPVYPPLRPTQVSLLAAPRVYRLRRPASPLSLGRRLRVPAHYFFRGRGTLPCHVRWPLQEPFLSYYTKSCRFFPMAKLSVFLVAFRPLQLVAPLWLLSLPHKGLRLVPYKTSPTPNPQAPAVQDHVQVPYKTLLHACV